MFTATTPPLPLFGPAFWDSFLPDAAPFVRVLRHAFDDLKRTERDTEHDYFWDEFRRARRADDLVRWFARVNISVRAQHHQGFSKDEWDALAAWNTKGYAWADLTVALLWRAVSRDDGDDIDEGPRRPV